MQYMVVAPPVPPPAQRRLALVGRGLHASRAAARTKPDVMPPLRAQRALCTPEEASLSADGLTLLRDAEVQRFLVDGMLLVQPSSLPSTFHANIVQQLENENEHSNNREHPCVARDVVDFDLPSADHHSGRLQWWLRYRT